MKRGDIIEFKRQGFVSTILGGVLKLFERDWDGWGWHLAIAWLQVGDLGWHILEATEDGVETNFYFNSWLKDEVRTYKWLDKVPSQKKMNKFLEGHLNKKYDVVIYFWTTLQYLIRHYFNHRIPRLLDDRFTCWELASEFCDEMGKPWESRYDCPMITDFLKVAKP